MARPKAAPVAISNVIALPGVSARKVDNYRFAEQRRAVIATRETSPFASRYISPQDRVADRLAQELNGIGQTPALLIVSAMLRTMEPAAFKRVLEQLAPGAVSGSTPARQAVATLKASRLCFGEQHDLYRAFDRLREEG